MKVTKKQLKRIIRASILEHGSSRHMPYTGNLKKKIDWEPMGGGSYGTVEKDKPPHDGYLEEMCLNFLENGNDFSGWTDWSLQYMHPEEASEMWDEIRLG